MDEGEAGPVLELIYGGMMYILASTLTDLQIFELAVLWIAGMAMALLTWKILLGYSFLQSIKFIFAGLIGVVFIVCIVLLIIEFHKLIYR